jgi:hypothetical protein
MRSGGDCSYLLAVSAMALKKTRYPGQRRLAENTLCAINQYCTALRCVSVHDESMKTRANIDIDNDAYSFAFAYASAKGITLATAACGGRYRQRQRLRAHHYKSNMFYVI